MRLSVFMRLFILLPVAVCSTCILAQTAGAPADATPNAALILAPNLPALVRPGRWAVTPQSTAGASVSYQVCFKTGSLDDVKLLLPRLEGGPECPQPRIEVGRATLTWQLGCPAKSLRVDARYTLAPDVIEGTVTITQSGAQGNPAAASVQSIKAQHAGACPP